MRNHYHREAPKDKEREVIGTLHKFYYKLFFFQTPSADHRLAVAIYGFFDGLNSPGCSSRSRGLSQPTDNPCSTDLTSKEAS